MKGVSDQGLGRAWGPSLIVGPVSGSFSAGDVSKVGFQFQRQVGAAGSASRLQA